LNDDDDEGPVPVSYRRELQSLGLLLVAVLALTAIFFWEPLFRAAVVVAMFVYLLLGGEMKVW
jgi:hypothetical protein